MSATDVSRKGRLSPNRGWAHWIVEAFALAYQSQGEPCPLGVRAHSTWSAVSHALAHGTSLAELRAGRHRTHSQDSRVSVLSQFLPVCWVTGNGREELAGVTLAAPFPLIRGYERLFPPPVQFPGLVNPGGILQDWAEQSDARPSTARFSGQPLYWARYLYGLIPLRVIPYVYSSTVRFPSL